jgi:integrase
MQSAGLWQDHHDRYAPVGRQPQPRLQGDAQAHRLRQGVNPKYVQELLGHADISLTLNVYSHILPDMGDAAAGAMDAALG